MSYGEKCTRFLIEPFLFVGRFAGVGMIVNNPFVFREVLVGVSDGGFDLYPLLLTVASFFCRFLRCFSFVAHFSRVFILAP